MTAFPPNRPEPGRVDYRTSLAVGLFLSVALHVALLLVWRGAPGSGLAGGGVQAPESRSPRPWDPEVVRAVTVVEPRREVEIPPPPEPVAASSPEVAAPEVAREVSLAGGELTAHAAERPPVAGSGGEGGAPGSAGGGSRRPPIPRSVLPEWDPPEEVRGTEVVVRVHVDSAGRATGPVELRPPTPSRDFNRRLREKVRAMEFSPARAGERAVSGWAELTFVF